MAENEVRILECQNYTIREAANIIRDGSNGILLASKESQIRVASWLDELDIARTAIYETRIALAKTKD